MGKVSFVFFLFIMLCQMSIAQEEDTIALEQVSVYSSGNVLSRNETGRNILVIPGSELMKHPAMSVDELLRYLPGIEAQSRGAFGVQSDFSIRGSTFTQVLVLIDGMRLNDPLTGHFNSYIPVAPSEIERIEILSGPAASIFGPDAVGGVIQIISKTFVNHAGPLGTRAEGRISGGQYGLLHLQTGGNLESQKIKLAGGIQWNRSDGNRLSSGLHADFDLRSASFSAGCRLNENTMLSLRTAFDDRNFNAQYFYTASLIDSSREKVNQWWNQLRLQRNVSHHQQVLDISWKLNHDDYKFNPGMPDNKNTTGYLQLRLGESFTLSDRLKFMASFQSGHKTIESTDRGNHHERYAGLSISGFAKPLLQLSFTANLRGDYNQNYGFEFLPQLSAAWTKDFLIIHGSVGRSIRAADFTERFVSTRLTVVAAKRNLGNPYLKAESAWNGELGADANINNSGIISLNLFYRNASNLIDYVLTNEKEIRNDQNLIAGADYLYARNIRDLQTKGLEFYYIASVSLGLKTRLRTRLGYTIENSDNPEHILSKYISNHARQMFTVDVNLQHRWLLLQMNGLWKQRDSEFSEKLNYEQKSEYFVCNGSVSADVWKNSLFLTLQANNLFDTQYSDILGAQMPGRWIMAGIRWKFVKYQSSLEKPLKKSGLAGLN